MVFESFPDSLSFFLWSTLLISIVLGIVVNKTNFCSMGAVSDMVNINDYGRFRAWLLAIAIAMIGVAVLEYLALVNVTDTFPAYREPGLTIGQNIIGGLLFGVGMTLGSGCGNKILIRIGGGNFKSIFVFAIISVIAFYMINPLPDSDATLFSLFFYDWIQHLSVTFDSNQDIGALLSNENTEPFRLVSGLTIGSLLLIYIIRATEFKTNKDNILAGFIVGLVILSGWYISSNISINADDSLYTMRDYHEEWDMLADDDEGKPLLSRPLSAQSYTFINPIGQTFGYIKSGFNSIILTFGLISVFGVILGSFLWSLYKRSLRFEWFADGKDFFMHLIGAVLMGTGGVLAKGCTIGQGTTGVSTLAIGSILTLISIVFSSALTMKIQYYQIVYEEESNFFKAFISSLVDLKLLPNSLRKLDAL